MALSIRIYLFPEDGSLKRIPRRVCEARSPLARTRSPNTPAPGSASRRCSSRTKTAGRSAYSTSGGTSRIFDAEGKIHEGLQERIADFMGAPRSKRAAGKVVDLVPEIKKRAAHERHRWTPTNDDIDRIAADIWPGIHGPAARVTAVKGSTPKKPPLSYEAKEALREIGIKVGMIDHQITQLNEHGLKGLEFEALRTASFEDGNLWRAVAEAAKRQRAIRAAYRTGKGEWIAVIDAMRSEDAITAVTKRRPRMTGALHARRRSKRASA